VSVNIHQKIDHYANAEVTGASLSRSHMDTLCTICQTHRSVRLTVPRLDHSCGLVPRLLSLVLWEPH